MVNYRTDPVARKDLRGFAKFIRNKLGIKGLYFPVIAFWEIFDDFCPECTLLICPDEAFENNVHGDTDINNKIIRIKESVYNGACSGFGRDRMTIMHEISHYLLLVESNFKLSRTIGNVKPKTYEDPEWQAKALAAELMIPYEQTNTMEAEEIAVECGVSLDSARYQENIFIKEKIAL